MWWNTIFNMLVVLGCIGTRQDTQVAKIAVEACFWSNTATLLMYVFGATIQDIFALKTGFKQSTVQVTENAGSPMVSQPTIPEASDSNTTIASDRVVISKPMVRQKVRKRK